MRGLAACAVIGLALGLVACERATPEKEYRAGLELLGAGRLSEGKARLESALERAPDAPFAVAAHNWLGLVNLELDLPDQAVDRFEYAAKLDPTRFDPVYNLGSLLLDSGDTSRGITLLRRAADLDPNDIRALMRIGEWTTRNGRWDLGKRMYFEAHKRDPQSAAALTGLGRIATLEDQVVRAEAYFMQALEVRKDYPPALYNLGVLHSQRPGHAAQSREYFRHYLELAPEGARASAAEARMAGQVIDQTFQPAGPTPPPVTAGILWSQAQDALESGDAENAYLQAMRALAMAREVGDAGQAGEILRRAVELFPGRADIHLEAGEYWLEHGDARSAHEALVRAQALEPGNPMILVTLARAATLTAEYDTAIIALRDLIRLEPANPDPVWSLAEIYGEKLGMTRRGISALRIFEKQFPSDPRALEVPERIRMLEEAEAALPPLEP